MKKRHALEMLAGFVSYAARPLWLFLIHVMITSQLTCLHDLSFSFNPWSVATRLRTSNARGTWATTTMGPPKDGASSVGSSRSSCGFSTRKSGASPVVLVHRSTVPSC